MGKDAQTSVLASPTVLSVEGAGLQLVSEALQIAVIEKAGGVYEASSQLRAFSSRRGVLNF